MIDNTIQAVTHYYRGKGVDVQLGENTVMKIKKSDDVNKYRDKITSGQTKSPDEGHGLIVDMTTESTSTFHLGKMTLSYSTKCEGNSCTTKFTVDDKGFVDPNQISANGLGIEDNKGPKVELGGTPYEYKSVIWSETYKNPGYKVDDKGIPSNVKKSNKKEKNESDKKK